MSFKAIATLVLFLSAFHADAQVSLEEFKATYQPTYEKLTPNYGPVVTYNDLDPTQYGAALIYLLDEYSRKDEILNNIVAILTSAERKKVALGISQLTTEDAIKILQLVKDEWVLEVAYFLDLETYQNIAPYLSALKYYSPKNNAPFFGKEVKNFTPIYAAVGPDFTWSRLKGLSTYVTAYNGWPTKVGTDGALYQLTEELNSPGKFKGFQISTGIKLGQRIYLDLGYQNRSTKSSGGGVDWSKDLKFRMHTFNLDIMKYQGSGFLTFARGFGFQYTIGNVKDRSRFGNEKTSYSKVGESVSNFGMKYKVGAWINPEKLPVAIGILPYAQVNFTKFNFTSVEDAKPQLAFGGGDPEDLRSTGFNIGVQVTIAYKLGKTKEKVLYPSFVEEFATGMDNSLNTSYPELSPRVSSDGKTLYFIRSDHPLNTEGALNSQDIWVSDISEGIDSSSAQHMGAPFNTARYNAVLGLSPDENTLMINGAFNNGIVTKGYSRVQRTATGWGEPQALQIEGFDEMANGQFASMYWTQDGKHLLLSFSEEENQPQDMYISHLLDDGTWSRPMSLGSDINTQDGENAPFLASDGKTIYFSSNRPGGEGSYDIWISKRLDETWTNWSAPINMGSSINTENFEAYYTIDARGEYAYMVATVNGSEDVVRIKLEEDKQPDPVVLITGKVLNANTNEPLGANIVYNDLLDGKNYGVATTNPLTGEYKIVLPYGHVYDFTAGASNYIGVSDVMDVSKTGSYQEINRDLYLVPVEVGSIVRLNNIFFEFGNATLQKESFNELNRLVELLKENPTMRVEIGGHTDNVGNIKSNITLSKQRAKACLEYVIQQGISADRVVAKGYGEEKPVASNESTEGKAENRRVEFTILSF